MKSLRSLIATLASATSFLFLTTSCEKLTNIDPMPIGNTTPSSQTSPPAPSGLDDLKIIQFDPATMKTKMDAFLNSRNLSGYAYSIFVNGQRVVSAEGQAGFARKAIDGSQLAHSPLVRQELASCTKYITTLAMVRMLDRAGLSLDTPIGPYLPLFMNTRATPIPNSVWNVTFKQLLSHHSGLVGGINDVNITLAKMIQSVQTSNLTMLDKYQYNNMNFALCRLLLPYIYWKEVLKLSTPTIQQKEGNQASLDLETANLFLYFVRNDVFKPANLALATQLGAGDPALTSPTLYYANNLLGSGSTDWSFLNLTNVTNLGSVGFDLNAVELTQITSAANDYKIVSESSMKAIRTGYKSRPLGFSDSSTGKYGEYYYKYGDISWGGVGLATMLVDFDCPSANVQAGVVTNTNDGGVSDITWIQNAFDTSWK